MVADFLLLPSFLKEKAMKNWENTLKILFKGETAISLTEAKSQLGIRIRDFTFLPEHQQEKMTHKF